MWITHSTYIACPPQQVWDVTTDVNDWPNWTPTVQTAYRLDKLRFGIGSQARIKQPMQPCAIWTVTEIEDGRYFVWETSGKAFRMQATHQVTGHGGGAECTLKIKLIGPVAIMCAIYLAPLIKLALVKENRGLKRRCERARPPASARESRPPDPTSDAEANGIAAR